MDSMTVLIIEDDKSLRIGLERILTKEGYKAYGAIDGMVGLDFLRNHQYDLVLLDIYLPRLNGMQLLRYIRQYKLAKHVIMLTAASELKIAQEAIKIGAEDILIKPFDLRTLLNSMKRILAPEVSNLTSTIQ
ncbi:MAG: response regulator [Ignavibacteriales bacterium]|nr:response regulator [Ignavibacteriales bacterium]